MVQKKSTNIEEAKKIAKEMSAEFGYAAIIFSAGTYYIENDTLLIRPNDETMVGEWKDGKLKGEIVEPFRYSRTKI